MNESINICYGDHIGFWRAQQYSIGEKYIHEIWEYLTASILVIWIKLISYSWIYSIAERYVRCMRMEGTRGLWQYAGQKVGKNQLLPGFKLWHCDWKSSALHIELQLPLIQIGLPIPSEYWQQSFLFPFLSNPCIYHPLGYNDD